MTIKCTIWMPVLIIAGICIAVCGVVSAASPQLPCEFYGAASVQGTPAGVGTVITAYVNGIPQGRITVTETGMFGGTGTFDERLIVMAGENDFADGVPTITFRINEQNADQTAPYQPGASTQLNLSVGGQTAVTAPVEAVAQGNNSTQVPVIVAQIPVEGQASPPVPVVTPVQNQSSQPVQAVNASAPAQ